VSEGERLERELKDSQAKWREVDQRLRAVKSEIVATTPLPPLETPQGPDKGRSKAASNLLQELETEYVRLSRECRRLRRELRRYR